jgi:type II secretory pathway pseudopilin PulG
MNSKTAQQNGFTILEGLIAVVIFAVGMIALATFQGGIMSESGEVKARNEAVVLAQDKSDELRAMMVRGDFDATIVTGTDTVAGNNAAFTRAWTVSDSATPEYKLLEVGVAWTDPDGDAQAANLDALVAWNDPRAGITQTGLTNPGRTIPEPSGGERNPGVVYDEIPPGAIDAGDGFSIYARPDGKTHLIRNDRTDTDGDGDIDTDDGYETVLEVYSEGIVMLRGVIELIDGSVTSAGELTAEVLALTSDAGFCVYPEPDTFSLSPEEAAANGTTSTNFFHCYVGENWYGNLGLAGADKLDSICPLILDYDPVISTSEAADLVSATVVSGSSIGAGILAVLPNQNFLIARLQGNDTCESFSTESPTAAVTGYFTVTDGAIDIGTTRIEATPDVACWISPDLFGFYLFGCAVDTGAADGWNGTVRLIPDPELGVCGVNYWSPASTLFADDVVTDVSFELTPLGAEPAGCVGTYEYTITLEVDQVGGGQGIADQLNVVTTPSEGCVMSSLAGGKKSAVYRCAVVAEPGTSVSLSASVTGHTVTPSSQVIQLPPAPDAAGGESWNFDVTATPVAID